MKYTVLFLSLIFMSSTTQTFAQGLFSLNEVSKLMSEPKLDIETFIKKKGYTMLGVSSSEIYTYKKKGTPFGVRFKLADGLVTVIVWEELKKALAPIIVEIEKQGYTPIDGKDNEFESPTTGMKILIFQDTHNPAIVKIAAGM